MSLLYASKEELGWDTSITARLEGKSKEEQKGEQKREGEDWTRYYSINVNGEEVTTDSKSVISDLKANGFIGPGTRIFKAKLAATNQDVVLKDYWPLEIFKPESETRDRITLALLKDDDGSFADTHILKPILYGKVRVNGEEDHTKKMILRGDIRHSFVDQFGKRGMERYNDRNHYRIVFKEVATPIDEIDNVEDLLLVVSDMLRSKYLNNYL